MIIIGYYCFVGGILTVSKFVYHIQTWCSRRSEALDPLELELEMFVNLLVGAGNQT